MAEFHVSAPLSVSYYHKTQKQQSFFAKTVQPIKLRRIGPFSGPCNESCRPNSSAPFHATKTDPDYTSRFWENSSKNDPIPDCHFAVYGFSHVCPAPDFRIVRSDSSAESSKSKRVVISTGTVSISLLNSSRLMM